LFWVINISSLPSYYHILHRPQEQPPLTGPVFFIFIRSRSLYNIAVSLLKTF
jgi:hypothetical protein